MTALSLLTACNEQDYPPVLRYPDRKRLIDADSRHSAFLGPAQMLGEVFVDKDCAWHARAVH